MNMSENKSENKMISKVIWHDAIQKEIPKSFIEKADIHIIGKNLLAINTTYGKIVELEDVVIVIHEESTDDDTDVTIIPKSLIIKIE